MLDERDIDRLLAGRPVEGEEGLGELLKAVRRDHSHDPDPELRERTLAAMAREMPVSEPRPTTRRRRSMLPTRIAVRLGAATGALLLGTAGLAVAGVNLPDPAADAFDRAGVTLPNQDNEDPADQGRSDEVQAIIDATPPSERDCAFGHRVAEAARGGPLPEEAREACERDEDAEAEGERRGEEGAARGEANNRAAEEHAEQQMRNGDANGSAGSDDFGRETSERARGQREATPDERRRFGEETSERAREHAGEQGQGNAAPPAGTPQGPPEGTPAPAPPGKPDGTPPAPDGTPGGPPAGTPGPGGRP